MSLADSRTIGIDTDTQVTTPVDKRYKTIHKIMVYKKI